MSIAPTLANVFTLLQRYSAKTRETCSSYGCDLLTKLLRQSSSMLTGVLSQFSEHLRSTERCDESSDRTKDQRTAEFYIGERTMRLGGRSGFVDIRL